MGKIISIFIALSIALTLIMPDMDIYAYFMNLLQNFPELLPVLQESADKWNEFIKTANELQISFNWNDLALTFGQFFGFVIEFLIVAPAKLLWWLLQVVVVVFGGAI